VREPEIWVSNQNRAAKKEQGKTQSVTRELHRAVTACGRRKSTLGVQSTGENEQIKQLDAHEGN
jgi:hypothetical protein